MSQNQVADLREALCRLGAALIIPAIIDSASEIEVHLPVRAGIRLEAMLLRDPPAQLIYAINRWGGERDVDTDNPKRFIVLDGIKLVWPTGRVAVLP